MLLLLNNLNLLLNHLETLKKSIPHLILGRLPYPTRPPTEELDPAIDLYPDYPQQPPSDPVKPPHLPAHPKPEHPPVEERMSLRAERSPGVIRPSSTLPLMMERNS
jgi:hypothetical protein